MRIFRDIEVQGRRLKALIDNGSLNSYIEAPAVPGGVPVFEVTPFRSNLAGEVRRACYLRGALDGVEFDDLLNISERPLGPAVPERVPVQVIFGALALERWGVKIDPRRGELDLSALKLREYTEF